MPYVNAREITRMARKGGYAVGQFNINNLESIRVFLEAAEACRAPLMIGVSSGIARQLGGWRTVADTVRNMMTYFHISVPVCLQADHSPYESALEALESGFSSVMFDGSRLPFAENLEKTARLAELCHARGVTLEAEVGPVAGKEDGGDAAGEMADPEECKRIAALGIDLLAAGIGSMHGAYPPDWQGLNFPLLESIRDAVPEVPLVLHGGSGVPPAMVRQAISLGICKINVNSECREAFDRETLRWAQSETDPTHMQLITLRPGLAGVRQTCEEKMRLFGCEHQAKNEEE